MLTLVVSFSLRKTVDELFFSVVVGGWWLELRFVDDLVDGTQTALPRLVLVTARTGGVISGCFLEVLAVFGADNSQSCKLAFRLWHLLFHPS